MSPVTRHALDCGLCCGLAGCDCMGTYRVLHDYPRTVKTGETTQTPDGLIKWNRAEWIHKGYANSFAEAKAKFGGHPVLELVGRLH